MNLKNLDLIGGTIKFWESAIRKRVLPIFTYYKEQFFLFLEEQRPLDFYC
jgi:hypothetical protein